MGDCPGDVGTIFPCASVATGPPTTRGVGYDETVAMSVSEKSDPLNNNRSPNVFAKA